MFEAVWGGLLGRFGHTEFYPVNPNPPRATNTPNPSLSDPTLSYKGGLGGFKGGLWGFYGPLLNRQLTEYA